MQHTEIRHATQPLSGGAFYCRSPMGEGLKTAEAGFSVVPAASSVAVSEKKKPAREQAGKDAMKK
ncbi:hypothetical protein RCM47_17660 [Escherichia coli]|nr:hypothetical protein [Escherichia coli]HEL8385917.1 hypothetical protein [Escherichia coli]HEM0106459.1 hypothetical protein [Escherichia coli]HEM0195976.1 hypothetical protein [Escherichia coli]